MLDYLPPAIATAAVALTYLFCLRPLLRRRQHAGGGAPSAALQRELALARTELELLHLQRDDRIAPPRDVDNPAAPTPPTGGRKA